MSEVLRRALLSERRPLLAWLLALLVVCGVTLGSWPAVNGSAADLDRVFRAMPPALTAFLGDGISTFSAASVVGSRMYGTLGLALVVGFAVSRGARAVAGHAAQGTLELLAAQPVSRRAVATGGLVAGALGLASLVLVEAAVLLAVQPLVDLDFRVRHVLAAATGLYAVAAVFGSVAFAVGAATLHRPAAVGAGAGLAGGMYLLTGLGDLVPALGTAATLSPFTHLDGTRVLGGGVAAAPVAVMAAATVLLCLLGTWALARRDLS